MNKSSLLWQSDRGRGVRVENRSDVRQQLHLLKFQAFIRDKVRNPNVRVFTADAHQR